MSKRLFCFLIVAFFLLSGNALAQSCSIGGSVPGAFVSSFSGHQILCINGNTGATSVIYTGGSTFFPEDLVVGPDGKLYIADSLSNRIWRMKQDGSEVQIIYDKLTATSTCTESSGGSATCPSGPEGPSFSGSDDLYFNTQGPSATGIWKIPGIAAMPPPPSFPGPVHVASSFTTFGEGTAFSVPGNLLAVDQAGNRVLSAVPPFSAPGSLITSLSKPFGAAVNTCGDILVATGGAVKRYDATSGSFLSTYVSFTKGDIPRYLEVDSGNRLFVVTAQDDSGSNGKIWRVDPVLATSTSDPITSCATGTKTFVVVLKSLLSGPDAVPNLMTSNALGLAVPATDFSITHTFNPGFNVSNIYNFGHHSYSVTYKQVFQTFSQSFTALKSQPPVPFVNPFPAGCEATSSCEPTPAGVRYSSLGGFVIEYQAESPIPTAGVDYAVSTPGTHDAAKIKIGFFTPDVFQTPGLAHAPGSNSVYQDDITHDFWASGGPGTDPTSGSNTDGFGSKYVVFNEQLKIPNATFALKEPTMSCTTTTGCNPQFKQGQSIRVAFTVTDTSGNAVPGVVARLSILKTDATPPQVQPVISKNNSNVDNLFSSGASGGLYTFTVDSSFLAAGTLQFTIFSNAFPPSQQIGSVFNVIIVP